MTEEPEHLQMLNPEQYRAVTTLKGALLILAGAGSGKTRVLTRRVAHLIHEGVDPRNIFAVTFTNKAASEMKERVIELSGEAGRKCWISTFHSSCVRILRRDIEPLGYTRRFAIYDDDDQIRLLRNIITDLGYDKKELPPRSMRSQIDKYKNALLSPQRLLDTHRARPGQPLIRIWRAYEEALLASDALDFNDLIGKTVELFESHPDVLKKWQERFHYMMVDEYQDTNASQYRLLRALAAEHGNLAVVGDDDQSIYGFRGSDISIILGFEQDFPEATVVRLEQNYRSTSNILDVANAVVAHNPGRIEKKLWTETSGGNPVTMWLANSPRDEARKVARGIVALRRHGYSFDDMAVIYRTNATSLPFEMALRELKIPHRIVGGRKFWARREVRDTLAYLRLVANPADDAAVLRIINVPSRGIGAKTLTKLRHEAAARGEPLLATARGFGAAGVSRGAKGVAEFVSMMDDITDAAPDTPLGLFVNDVLDRTGYREMVGEEEGRLGKNRVDNLNQMVREAAAFHHDHSQTPPLDVLFAWLDQITLAADADEISDDGVVTLMTVHCSKGLEYPVVFVVHMMEGQFPHERALDEVDEERRLAYVAFTRAQQRLYVTRSRTLGRGSDEALAPSRFLFGIPTEACQGDFPTAEPGPEDEFEQPAVNDALAAFLGQRAARAAAPPSADSFSTREIEGLHQLKPGVRVVHEQYGIGVIQSAPRKGPGAGVKVSFTGFRPLFVPLSESSLQLVVE